MSTAPSAPPSSPNASAPSPDNTVVQTAKKVRTAILQLMLVFSPLINVLTLTSSIYMMQVFDRVMSSQSMSTLVYLTLIAIAALALMAVLELIRSRILTRLGSWMEMKLSGEGLQRAVEASLMGKPYRSEIMRDLSTLRGFFSSPSLPTLMDAPYIPVFLLVMFALHPALGWLTVIGALTLMAFAWLNDKLTHEDVKKATQGTQTAMRRTESALRNAEVIDVLGMLPGILSRWRGDNKNAAELTEIASDRSGSILAVSRFVRYTLQIMVLALGAKLALDRELSSGGMIAASILMGRALAPIEGSISSWRYTLSARQAYQRLLDGFNQPLFRDKTANLSLPRPSGKLDVEAVSYVAPGQKHPIIRGVTFSLRAGEIAALVGPSAAGKSTLARLCVGAMPPTYGNVRLDSADVFLWNREEFSQYIGYLPQDVELFAGTVRENIARLMPVDPALVVEAAQLAGAHDMILRLPQGYETEIGDGGMWLSGGQRQRIGLARAVLGKPQLVVLDEPNSSLDAEGEEALNTAIGRLKQAGVTVLMIGHRPSILTHVDTIIVLRDGRIEAMGPKQEILGKIMPKTQPMRVSGQATAQMATSAPTPNGETA